MAFVNSGTTLDVNPTPGRDFRFAATSSESVFTFGNFRIDRNIQQKSSIHLHQGNYGHSWFRG